MAATVSLRRLFFISGISMLAFMLLMKKVVIPLTTGDIVQFELAKDATRAIDIITEWSLSPDNKIGKAFRAIQLDFIFIILYTAFFFLGTRFMGNLAENPVWKKAGRFSWLVILAGLCDITENFTMLHTLSGQYDQWTVRLTYNMAVIKFSLLMIAAFSF